MSIIPVRKFQQLGFKVLGEHTYEAEMVQILDEVHAWDSLMSHAVKELPNDFDVYIVAAANAGYFKSDGQQYTAHVFIHNKEAKYAYLETCFCSWTQAELKEHMLELVTKYSTKERLNKANLVKRANEVSKQQPWMFKKVQ